MSIRTVTKEYTNGEITVVWKSGLCIHSKNCFNGLPEVFNPQQRPWINMEAANSDIIMAQVNKCPSGALSYYKNEEGTMDKEEKKTDSSVKVEVTKNGPLLIYGDITVKHKDGNEEPKTKVTALCRCGLSSNKPFCDGTHTKQGFKDE